MMMIASTLRHFALLLLLPIAAFSSSDSPYMSVTALDKYGNSVQLEHARQAALRHGKLVVAARASDGSIVVVAPAPEAQPGIIRSEQQEIVCKFGLSATSGIVCSGLKADAKWLVAKLRDYQKRNWEVYDVDTPSLLQMKNAASQALLTFMGYNRNKELGGAMVDDKDDKWARPLGVTSLLVAIGEPILLLDPSGSIVPFHAYAIGRDSEEVNQKLEQEYQVGQPVEQVKQLLMDCVKLVHDDDTELVVQILNEE